MPRVPQVAKKSSAPVYLDNHASTPIDPEALNAFVEASNRFPGNPHSEHCKPGRKAADLIEQAREVTGQAFRPFMEFSKVLFTSGATESNNLALAGSIASLPERTKKDTIVISAIEHKSVLETARFLSSKHGMTLVEVPVSEKGRLDIQFLQDHVNDKTAIVSVQSTNSEIGVNQDLGTINDICKKHGAIFHSDLTQGAYLNTQLNGEADLISISGHKRYGPQGIGALICNTFGDFTNINPVMYGGGQQDGIRPGTLPTALIHAFAKAIELGEGNKDTEAKQLLKLRDDFYSRLQSHDISFEINGDLNERHPGNINITLADIEAFDLINKTEADIAISTSSACASADSSPSYVLQAIGLGRSQILKSIRIGVGRFNSEDDMQLAADTITDAIRQAKQAS